METYTGKEVTNDISDRTLPGIFRGTIGNIQGTMRVFGVNTGIVKKFYNATKFSIPNDIIKKINAWRKNFKRQDLKNRLQFVDRRQNSYKWNNENPNTTWD